MGHPQFKSTKSRLPANSLAMISAVGTRVAGLFPASWIPNVFSDECRRTRDHSSLDADKKEVASPISPQVMSAPNVAQRRRNGYGRECHCLQGIAI